MDLRTVKSERAPAAVGPYSHAVVAGGQVFCSGQVALDPATGQPIGGDIKAQTARVLDNLAAVLESAGSDLAHVLKTTVFLADMGHFAAMNEVYAERFGAHRPARATVGGLRLPRGLLVEIECIAAVK